MYIPVTCCLPYENQYLCLDVRLHEWDCLGLLPASFWWETLAELWRAGGGSISVSRYDLLRL